MPGSTKSEHDRVRETINSIADSNKQIEAVKDLGDMIQIELDNTNTVEPIVKHIKTSEVGDSTYRVDSSLAHDGIVRVVSPEQRQTEQEVKAKINEYTERFL